MCHDGKTLNLKFIRTPMVGETKLYLVLMDQMNNEKNNGCGSIGSTPRNSWGGARKNGPPPNHIRGMLVRYKNVFMATISNEPDFLSVSNNHSWNNALDA